VLRRERKHNQNLTALALSTDNKALLLVDRTDDRAQATTVCGRSFSTAAAAPASAPVCQGPDDYGQQHLQQLAHGGCLARQVDGSAHRTSRALTPPGGNSVAGHLLYEYQTNVAIFFALVMATYRSRWGSSVFDFAAIQFRAPHGRSSAA
jgi:hypothetical protein